MSKYYITIISIASMITVSIFLTNQTLLSTSNKVETEAKNLSNLDRTANLQPKNLQESANSLAQKNQWLQQLATLQQDLKKSQKNGDIEQEIRTLNIIVITYTELSEYPKALEYLQLAQTKLNQSNLSAEKKSFIEPELLIALGTIYADQGNYTQVLEITRKIGEIQNIRIGSLGSGIGNIERTPEKKQAQPDVRKDAHSLYLIATTQQKRGKNREALRTAEEALKMLRTVQEKEGEKEVTKFINTLRQQL
ncbi:Fis family transcriptional regulator [Nostoc sp. NIES-4103]|nr:Fis family transcriptional regulator [Nostoc sp. NIES-4103]